MMKLVKAVFLYVFLLGLIQANEKISIEDFTRSAEFTSAKISPDGKHIAAGVWLGDRSAVSITNVLSGKIVYLFKFNSPNEHIGSYIWINNERIVFSKYTQSKHNMSSSSMGQLYSGNIDGSRQLVIFGHFAKSSGFLNTAKGGRFSGSGRVISTLKNDEKNIIVLGRRFGTDPDTAQEIFKVNAYTGKSKRIGKTPLGGINVNVIVDIDGKPVFAGGIIYNGNYKAFIYKNNDWTDVTESINFDSPTALLVNRSGTTVYFSGYEGGKEAIFSLAVKNGIFSKIYQSKLHDIYNFSIDPISREIISVDIMDGRVSTTYLDSENKYSVINQSLKAAFKTEYANILSYSTDGSKAIAIVASDQNIGDYYLINTSPLSADYLMSRKSWIDPKVVPQKTPIKFSARDGQQIQGYITTPVSYEGKLPLVVLVHGGPYDVQDEWFFDGLAQPIANEGLAVLQVNYRGSSGYGLEFEMSGYGKPHTLLMEDIIDGVKWTMDLDYIQSNNACVFGWSFGGYSAAMLPAIEQSLFKCSVAGAGVYDMVYQQNNADYRAVDSVFSEVKKLYGTDTSKWKEMSPIAYADKIKIPMLLIHGGKDARVPVEQAHRYRKELLKNGVSVEWLYKPEEPHSFQKVGNKIDMFNESIHFIKRHLK